MSISGPNAGRLPAPGPLPGTFWDGGAVEKEAAQGHSLSAVPLAREALSGKGSGSVKNTLKLGGLVVWALACLVPKSGSAQDWEIEGGWSMIDYDPPKSLLFSIDHLPAGGRLLVRRQMADGRYFLEGGVMYGRQTSSSGESWMRSWTLSGGRALRAKVGRWVFGLRPTVGLGTLRWNLQAGRYSSGNGNWIYSTSVEAEFGIVSPFGVPLAISITTGIGRVAPLRPETCSECMDVLRSSPLIRRSIGLMVRPVRRRALEDPRTPPSAKGLC